MQHVSQEKTFTASWCTFFLWFKRHSSFRITKLHSLQNNVSPSLKLLLKWLSKLSTLCWQYGHTNLLFGMLYHFWLLISGALPETKKYKNVILSSQHVQSRWRYYDFKLELIGIMFCLSMCFFNMMFQIVSLTVSIWTCDTLEVL